MLTTIGAMLRGAGQVVMPLVHGRHTVVLQPYRGYGSTRAVFLMGRVFRQPGPAEPPSQGEIGTLTRLFLRGGIGEAVLKARLGETEQRVVTDHQGYFRIRMDLPELPPSDGLWRDMEIELVRPVKARVRGEFFVPPQTARFVVISDIDDTVMETDVANPVAMLQRLFLQAAEKRVAFPGVASFYRSLHLGFSGRERNPMLYVSRAPWGIYEMLDRFFRLHGIPVGPILFLRDWGMSWRRPLPRQDRDYKLHLIRDMLSLYGDLPFILIGDSGQQDPEVYAQIVEENPGRVVAVYIRNVTKAPRRHAAIEELAKKVVSAGSSLVLAADSFIMAEHAAKRDLISSEALFEVLQERTEQQGTADLKPTTEVVRGSREETTQAVEGGELRTAIEMETGSESPPNVVVRPECEDAADRVKDATSKQSGQNP
ncbi:MAG: App1 family protein [Solirubrobacterales bacterium]